MPRAALGQSSGQLLTVTTSPDCLPICLPRPPAVRGHLISMAGLRLDVMAKHSPSVSAAAGPFHLAEDRGWQPGQAELSPSVYPLILTCSTREAWRGCLLSGIPTPGEMCDMRLLLRDQTASLCLYSVPQSWMYLDLSPGHSASHGRARLQTPKCLTTQSPPSFFTAEKTLVFQMGGQSRGENRTLLTLAVSQILT